MPLEIVIGMEIRGQRKSSRSLYKWQMKDLKRELQQSFMILMISILFPKKSFFESVCSKAKWTNTFNNDPNDLYSYKIRTKYVQNTYKIRTKYVQNTYKIRTHTSCKSSVIVMYMVGSVFKCIFTSTKLESWIVHDLNFDADNLYSLFFFFRLVVFEIAKFLSEISTEAPDGSLDFVSLPLVVLHYFFLKKIPIFFV